MLTYERPTGETHNSPRVWNKYANTNQKILTLAVLAPNGIDNDPYERNAKPKPKSINPIENLIGPDGLYFEAQILEKIGANIIINNEFNTENQDAGISVASWLNSLLIIQITIPQIITKLIPRKKFDKKYFWKIFWNNRNKT